MTRSKSSPATAKPRKPARNDAVSDVTTRPSVQPTARDKKVLRIPMTPDDNAEEVRAKLSIAPEMNSGLVAHAFSGNLLGDDATGITELVEALCDSTKRVNAGDLSRLEAMLVAQATALQTIFASYARRAQAQEYQRNLEAFMGLALKAQAQSRATIQALVDLKFPRQATFVRQANIAHGPQQVNNGQPQNRQVSDSGSPAEKNGIAPNELLEAQDGERLDFGTPTAASRANQGMAPVGAVNRAEVERRQSHHRPERLEGRRKAGYA